MEGKVRKKEEESAKKIPRCRNFITNLHAFAFVAGLKATDRIPSMWKPLRMQFSNGSVEVSRRQGFTVTAAGALGCESDLFSTCFLRNLYSPSRLIFVVLAKVSLVS